MVLFVSLEGRGKALLLHELYLTWPPSPSSILSETWRSNFLLAGYHCKYKEVNSKNYIVSSLFCLIMTISIIILRENDNGPLSKRPRTVDMKELWIRLHRCFKCYQIHDTIKWHMLLFRNTWIKVWFQRNWEFEVLDQAAIEPSAIIRYLKKAQMGVVEVGKLKTVNFIGNKASKEKNNSPPFCNLIILIQVALLFHKMNNIKLCDMWDTLVTKSFLSYYTSKTVISWFLSQVYKLWGLSKSRQ